MVDKVRFGRRLLCVCVLSVLERSNYVSIVCSIANRFRRRNRGDNVLFILYGRLSIPCRGRNERAPAAIITRARNTARPKAIRAFFFFF